VGGGMRGCGNSKSGTACHNRSAIVRPQFDRRFFYAKSKFLLVMMLSLILLISPGHSARSEDARIAPNSWNQCRGLAPLLALLQQNHDDPDSIKRVGAALSVRSRSSILRQMRIYPTTQDRAEDVRNQLSDVFQALSSKYMTVQIAFSDPAWPRSAIVGQVQDLPIGMGLGSVTWYGNHLLTSLSNSYETIISKVSGRYSAICVSSRASASRAQGRAIWIVASIPRHNTQQGIRFSCSLAENVPLLSCGAYMVSGEGIVRVVFSITSEAIFSDFVSWMRIAMGVWWPQQLE
jgi:hypothetical protein